MDERMAAQEHVALTRSLLDRYNNRQSDPAWLEKNLAAFAADFEVIDAPTGTTLHGPDGLKRLLLFFVESFPDLRAERINAFATEDQVILQGDLAVERHRYPVSALGSSSKHGALGQTAVLFCRTNQEGEDRQSPRLLRYEDPDGTTRSGSYMGTGDGVTSQARFSCSMSNALGNSCWLNAIF